MSKKIKPEGVSEHINLEIKKESARFIKKIDRESDIGVDAKANQIVMSFANQRGRTAVEALWPEVEWVTDDIFSRIHSPDWMFTHIRVTRIPASFASTPLDAVTPDSLGLLVAFALGQRAEPRRVFHYTGQGANMQINIYSNRSECNWDGLLIEYVPATVAPPGGSIRQH